MVTVFRVRITKYFKLSITNECDIIPGFTRHKYPDSLVIYWLIVMIQIRLSV